MEKGTLAAGHRIDGWVFERPLGTGGMGSVYRCRNASTDRIVAALKVLDGALRADADANARFLREAEILAGLDHPNIVRIRNVRLDADPPYLEMEFVEGEPLDAVLRRGAVPLDRALALFRQAAEAIAYAHQRGVRHRDLKPANLLVDASDRLRIVDFGLATDTELQRITEHGLNFGTVSYSPPEWMDPDRLDPVQWDLYALGVILYELLTGAMAYPLSGEGPMKRQLLQVMMQKQVAPPLDPGEPFPDALRALVRDLTRATAAERPADAAELLRRLGEVHAAVGGFPAPSAPAPAAAPPPAPVDALPATPAVGRLRLGPGLLAGMGVAGLLGLLAGAAALVALYVASLRRAEEVPPPAVEPVAPAPVAPAPAPDAARVVTFRVAGAPADAPVRITLGERTARVERGVATLEAPPAGGTARWVAGERCDACPGPTCPEWCGAGEVSVPPGEGPAEVPVTLRPASGTVRAQVPALGKNRVRKKGQWTLELGGRAGSPTGDDAMTFSGVAPGRHRVVAVLGECPPAATGCWPEGACPARCSSQVVEVVVPWTGGDRSVTLDLPVP